MRIEVKYAYTIPYAFLDVLKRIYELMEKKHGYKPVIKHFTEERENIHEQEIAV